MRCPHGSGSPVSFLNRCCRIIPLFGLFGCQPARSSRPCMIFFASVNLFDDKARQELPMFEQRMDRMAGRCSDAWTAANYRPGGPQKSRAEALLYAAFVYITTHHAFEDGYMSLAGRPPHRFTAQDDDAAGFRDAACGAAPKPPPSFCPTMHRLRNEAP